jgi:hypothetical protein
MLKRFGALLMALVPPPDRSLFSQDTGYHIVGCVVRHSKNWLLTAVQSLGLCGPARSRKAVSAAFATTERLRPVYPGEPTSFVDRASRQGRAMCGRLRVGKSFLHVQQVVGAAMCSAC